MEAVIAHVVKNKAESVYARSDLFEKRRALMEAWSGLLTAPRHRAAPGSRFRQPL